MPLIKTETKFTDGFLAVVRYFKLYQKEGLWLAFLGIISAILNGLVPFIVGRFFDSIVTPGTFAIFNFVLSLSVSYLVIWLIIQIAASLIDWKRNIGSINLGINVYSDYIAGGHSFLLQLPQSFHSKHKVGKIADKINRAANSLETMVNKTMVEIAPPILSIFIALGLSFYIRPSLTLILLLGVGIYLYLSLKKIGPLAKLQIQMNKAYGDAYGDSYDAIFNVAEVKQATTELHEKKKIFYKFKERAGKLYVKMTSIWRISTFCNESLLSEFS